MEHRYLIVVAIVTSKSLKLEDKVMLANGVKSEVKDWEVELNCDVSVRSVDVQEANDPFAEPK